MTRLVPYASALVSLLVAGCGGGDEAGGPPETTAPDATTTVTTTTTTTTTTTVASGLPGGELVPCESPAGFVVGRPESWSTNSGEVVPACSQLHPEPFDVPGATDERVAAITLYVDEVPFADAAAPQSGRNADRAVTTVDGLQAVRLEYETDGGGFWPEGTPIALYAIDLAPGPDDGPGTLFVDTVGLEPFDFEQNRVVLDRVARSVEVTLSGVPTDPSIVARYEGGGGGFTVEGEVAGEQACLRIPPGGERVCTDVPEADQAHTVRLVDLEPVLAGVAGEDVFSVTAERRDGEPSTVLPAPVGDAGVRGFAFTFDLDAVTRLVLRDVTGAELRTIEPGG